MCFVVEKKFKNSNDDDKYSNDKKNYKFLLFVFEKLNEIDQPPTHTHFVAEA